MLAARPRGCGWLLSLSNGPPRPGHPQVDSTRYYEACVSDACACDTGGDCECFCTAVAAYARACHEVGVCVSWRTPDICRESGSPWWWEQVVRPLWGLPSAHPGSRDLHVRVPPPGENQTGGS